MDKRPNPDVLLEALNTASAQAKEGRLKIFLGMCPGVGKTYAMLLAAQQRQEEGRHVMIGVVETHGRIETQALTAGLARIPLRRTMHRTVTLEEMDIDAVLAHKPDLVIVDELAHSNITGSRHPKRWQDVMELLEAGIDVFTTLNVQHIESCRDVVTQITGAPVHESVPDSIIDRANEIELIDVSPSELRQRLEEGKIYLGHRAATAADHFFREGNLKALREISLRLTAEKADSEMRDFLRTQQIEGPWRSRERFLVAVGASPHSEHLIRWTRRIATLTHGTWIAVSIDTGRILNEKDKTHLEKNLTLARSLGAEVLVTAGATVTETIVRIASERNISQIVVGKPLTHPLFDMLRGGSLVDRLIRKSGDIDIYVVRAGKSLKSWRPTFREPFTPQLTREFGHSVLLVLATTLAALLLKSAIGYTAVGLLYLFAVLLGSTVLSRWPLLLAATLTALAWNFLFIPPYHTLRISSVHDLFLFFLYFFVAIVIGHLSSRLRQRERSERRREEQATALYHFSRDIVRSRSLSEAIQEGCRHIEDLFGATAIVLTGPQLASPNNSKLSPHEFAVATWAFDKKEPAGRFTDTLPQAEYTWLPLTSGNNAAGVIGIKSRTPLSLPERQLLNTFAAQIALLIEREQLMKEAEISRLEEKSRVLQKTLLDSVSHEFKTPLAVIAASAETLTKQPNRLVELAEEIRVASLRLHRIVENLLDMTRIETGSVRPMPDWCDLHEIFNTAIARSQPDISDHVIEINIDDKVAVCYLDPGLMEEVLSNLLRNAAKHSPVNTSINLSASGESGDVTLRVIDHGEGIPKSEQERIFDKFIRGEGALPGGLGLGLSIVRGLVEAQGGTVRVVPNLESHLGTQFEIRLPSKSRDSKSINS